MHQRRAPPDSTTSLAPSLTASSHKSRKDSDARIKVVSPTSNNTPSTSTSTSFGNFFGIGGGKPKRPPDFNYPPPIDVKVEPSVLSSNASTTTKSTGSRNRAYTLSGSTSSTRWPITPVTSVEGESQYLAVRGRSDSLASQATSSLSAKRTGGGKTQLPALLSVEEFDPFASKTNTFYMYPTPPPLTPDSQSFGELLNTTFNLPPSPLRDEYEYEDAGFGASSRKSKPKPDVIAPLRLTRRPSAPPLHTITPNPASPLSQTSGPSSAGPLGKKQVPLLPFRNGKEKP